MPRKRKARAKRRSDRQPQLKSRRQIGGGWFGVRPFQLVLSAVTTIIVTVVVVPRFRRPHITVASGAMYQDVVPVDSADERVFYISLYNLDLWCRELSETEIRSKLAWSPSAGGELRWYLKVSNTGRVAAHNVHVRLAMLPRTLSSEWTGDPRSTTNVVTSSSPGDAHRFYDVALQTVPAISNRYVELRGAIDSASLTWLERRQLEITFIGLSTEETGDLASTPMLHVNGIHLMFEAAAALNGQIGVARKIETFDVHNDSARAVAESSVRWVRPLNTPPCLKPSVRDKF